MSTTLHLFRHDVHRLRWWLLAWAGFLIGTHWWVSATLWTGRFRNHEWPFNVVRAEQIILIVWLVLLATLAALLLLPHGAEGTRLFWRTRPIAARDMVRAKFLFAGLFFIALPMAVETVFWRAWVPWGRVVEFWPEMLLERTGWAALAVLALALGGREGKRYGLCVAGLLMGFFGWMTFGEQLSMRMVAATGEDGVWPTLDSPHFLGQLWQFWTKNSPGRADAMTHTSVMVLFITFAVASWVVVACRYLWAGWRATRLAIGGALLVAIGTATALSEWGPAKKWDRQDEVHSFRAHLAKGLQDIRVQLQSARLVPERELTSRIPHANDSPVVKRVAEFTWAATGQPPGTVLLTWLSSVGTEGKSSAVVTYLPHAFGRTHVGYYVGNEPAQIAEAMPELAGNRVLAKREPGWHRVELRADWVEEINRTPTTASATVEVGVLVPVTLAVLPVARPADLWLDQAHIRLEGGPESRLRVTVPRHLAERYLDDPFVTPKVPNLFVLRNPVRKEALVVDSFVAEQGYGNLWAPASSRQEDMRHELSNLNAALARHGLDAAWLAEAELLCVRLRLTAYAHQKVRLENFRLEPAVP